jgi:hypothetical protein
VADPQLTDVAGIGEAGAARLRQAGLSTPQALADASLADIAAVPGFGRLTAGRVKRSARSLVGRARAVAAAPVATGELEPGKKKGKDGKRKAKADEKAGKKHKKGKKGKKGKKAAKGKKGKKKGKGGKKR